VVVDRIERHDVLNAIMLAGAVLLLGYGLVTAAGSLASTVDEGLVDSSDEPSIESEDFAAGATTTSDPTSEEGGDDTAEPTVAEARPPGEVTVRVGNGARRPGVAGAGTEALEAAGYPALSPKNGPTMDDSVAYYVDGYVADAARVAEVLGLEPTQIAPMPSDPGVPIEGAHVIVILGVNSNF